MSISTLALLLVLNLVLSVCLFFSIMMLWRQQQKSKLQISNQLMALKGAYERINQAYSSVNKKLTELESKQPAEPKQTAPLGSLNLSNQVARLVSLGASVDDLVEQHGVPRGEAELLVSLRDQKAH